MIVSYVVAFSMKYCKTKCFEKKSYGEYLLNFCWNDVCNSPENNVKTNVYLMNSNNSNNSNKECKKHKKDNNNNGDDSGENQVFNIENQDYTYEQARCKCESYNSKLATYEQIVNAYNKGGDWCTYGWSEGQNAYYPTQQCTWEKLQRGPKKDRNNCGKSGINGGFFSDPYLKFGANCYGKKPKGEVAQMKKPLCKRKAFCKRKDNYNASNKLSTDQIAPFNKDRWNE